MRFLNLYCCVALVLCGTGSAYAETLEGAVHSALVTHPSVDAAQAALDGAREREREAYSGYFPELSVSATGGRIYGDNATTRGLVTSRGAAYSYLWEGSVRARQMIFDGFETSRRVGSAQAQQLSADMSLEDVQEYLAYSTVQTYVDLMRAQKGLAMLEGQYAKVVDYVARIKDAVDEGVSDEAEYQQALDVEATLEGLVADYKGQKASAESQYIELVGALPEGEMENPSPAVDFIIEDVNEAVEYAMGAHRSVQAAKLSAKAARYDVDVEKASLYPDLDGEVSFLKTDKKEEIGGEVEDAKAVLRLNWNFETGGGQLARVAQRRSEAREAQARLDEIKKQVERGVRLSYAEYITSLDLLENQMKRVKLNSDLLETFEIQFEGARVSLLQLMQTDNQHFIARLERMNATHRALLAQYAVLASVGRLQQSLTKPEEVAEIYGPISGGQMASVAAEVYGPQFEIVSESEPAAGDVMPDEVAVETVDFESEAEAGAEAGGSEIIPDSIDEQ